MTAEAKNQITKTMADNELTISGLQEQIGGYEGTVGDLNTTIADQQLQIDDLKAQLDAKNTPPAEEPVEGPITSIDEGFFEEPVGDPAPTV
ncbi:MAG: hypothetical protein ACXABY_35265 [Candidatus Thorarchaeota archaeon]|jgi:hypothetical protein